MTQTSTPKADSGILSDAEGYGEENSTSKGNEAACPLCHDNGFVHPLMPDGMPDYARVVPCRCRISTLSRAKQSHLERYSNLGYLAHYTFDTMRPDGRKGGSEVFHSAYSKARAYAENPKGWLVLLGPAGSGKTYLACAIANARLALGEAAFYVSTADLLDHLRGAFSPDSEVSYDDLFEQVKNVGLLVLDDVRLEGATPWAREKLEQILNHRYNLRLPSVITTDLEESDLDIRLSDRLLDSDFCSICVVAKPRLSGMDILELPKGLKVETFDNFDYGRVELSLEERDNLQAAYTLAVDFAAEPEGWVVFQGRNGCGKTHLAAAIANYRASKGQPVLFLVVADLLDYLRSAFGPESRISYSKIFEEVKQCPLLILDDFGEQASTPWARSKLFQLINYRYNARLPMVVTMEQSLEQIEIRFGSRFADPRFNTVFEIRAPHYNLDVDDGHVGKRD